MTRRTAFWFYPPFSCPQDYVHHFRQTAHGLARSPPDGRVRTRVGSVGSWALSPALWGSSASGPASRWPLWSHTGQHAGSSLHPSLGLECVSPGPHSCPFSSSLLFCGTRPRGAPGERVRHSRAQYLDAPLLNAPAWLLRAGHGVTPPANAIPPWPRGLLASRVAVEALESGHVRCGSFILSRESLGPSSSCSAFCGLKSIWDFSPRVALLSHSAVTSVRTPSQQSLARCSATLSTSKGMSLGVPSCFATLSVFHVFCVFALFSFSFLLECGH